MHLWYILTVFPVLLVSERNKNVFEPENLFKAARYEPGRPNLPMHLGGAMPSFPFLASTTSHRKTLDVSDLDRYAMFPDELRDDGLLLHPMFKDRSSINPEKSYYDANGFYHHKEESEEKISVDTKEGPSVEELYATYGPFDTTMTPKELSAARHLWPYVMWWKVPQRKSVMQYHPRKRMSNIVGMPNGAFHGTKMFLPQYARPSPMFPPNKEHIKKFKDFDPYILVRRAKHGELNLTPEMENIKE